MSQIGHAFKNEGQYMPPSEIETIKIQHQIDGVIPSAEINCILRGDTGFENVLLTSWVCFTIFSWET